jgi:RNA polymerase sigma factor, sigma-70 family
MHRAIASYANGGAAPVLDDTTVLEQYGSLVERTALSREATVEEVASDLGVEVEEASDMAALLEPPLPLDSILPTLAGGEATDATVLRAEAVGRLTDAIEKLPERLRLVLSLHYIEDLTYREIAGILKVSEPRVCQLHPEAISQLRKLLPDA